MRVINVARGFAVYMAGMAVVLMAFAVLLVMVLR